MLIEDDVVETLPESSDENTEISLGDTIKEAFERSRDDQGKFKQESEAEITPEVTGEISEDKAPAIKGMKPPESWTPASKAKFAELPPEIQQEVMRREEEVHRGFTKFDQQRVFGKQVEDVLSPYLPMIRSEGGDPLEAIGGMLQTGYILRTGDNESKVRAIGFLANKYNIDLSPLLRPQGQMQGQFVDPTVQQLQNQVWQLTQAQQNQQNFAEQQEQAQIHSTIDSFASDPANIYFENVKPEMAALLKEGRAQDMQEAYDMACWARPDIRPLMLQSQNKRLSEQNREKVNKARNASVSITGSPVGSTKSIKSQDRTLSEEIAENLRAAQGRA
jgi:hypothetical protein